MTNSGHLELHNTILAHAKVEHLAIKECFHHTRLGLFQLDFMQYRGRMYFQRDLINLNVSSI